MGIAFHTLAYWRIVHIDTLFKYHHNHLIFPSVPASCRTRSCCSAGNLEKLSIFCKASSFLLV